MTKDDVKSKEKSIHDGVSPINVPDEDDEDKLFQMLWEYLVPPCGKVQRAQGEIIRIAGRVQHEFMPYKMGLIWITVMSVLKCSMQSVQTNVECAFMEKS